MWLSTLGTIVGAIDPDIGIKLKINIIRKNNSESVATIIRFLNIFTHINESELYKPIPDPGDLLLARISNIMPGSNVLIENLTKASTILNEVSTSCIWELYYENNDLFSLGDTVKVTITYNNGLLAKYPYTITTVVDANGWTLVADQKDDIIYDALILSEIIN